MDSQRPSNNNDHNNSGSSTLFSEFLEDQESLFHRYVSTLSPLKASSVAQGSLGLNSSPLEFKSPCLSHCETQFLGRPQGTQSLGVEISQSGKGGNCLGEDLADSGKSNSQKPLPEMSITDDINQMYAIFEAYTQHNSPLSNEQYLVDPGDIDQMCAAKKSLSDPILSMEDILKIDRKDGLSDKVEESLPLTNDPTNFEQYSHDQLSKEIKGCEDYNQMESTSHVTLENILQDDTVDLKYDSNRCRQYEDGNSEELNQHLSASKKRKHQPPLADGNGCKRCTCLKSKCLKLYCVCFALGIYCTDPCECQGCLNRPEYVDTVHETRQQIESRNPHAFAPKIIRSNTDNKENINLNLRTPSSARHKSGCNCKKSTCLKKYCECYRANVGCSSACRCEGCKNTYGKNEDSVVLEQDALSKEQVSSIAQKGLESKLRSKLELVTNMGYNLSPTTPSLQCSHQGKEAAKSRVISGNYLPSSVSHTELPGGSFGWHSSVTPGTRVGEPQRFFW